MNKDDGEGMRAQKRETDGHTQWKKPFLYSQCIRQGHKKSGQVIDVACLLFFFFFFYFFILFLLVLVSVSSFTPGVGSTHATL